MATKIVKTRLVLRNDKSTTWSSKNPILLKGEVGIEEDTRKFKIGDGVSNWNSLLYANITDLSNYYTKPAMDEIVKNLATIEYVDNKVSTEIEKITQGGKIATLGEDGKISASQLPSYVDDVVEGYYYSNSSTFQIADFTPGPLPVNSTISKIYFHYNFFSNTPSPYIPIQSLIEDIIGDRTGSRTICTFSSGYTIRFISSRSSNKYTYAIKLCDASSNGVPGHVYFYHQSPTCNTPFDYYTLPDNIGSITDVYIPTDTAVQHALYNFIGAQPFTYVDATPESGKIYVDAKTNKTYRWSGSLYTEISASLALGTTNSTAYPGSDGLALKNRVDAMEPLVNLVSGIKTQVDTNTDDIDTLKSQTSDNTTNISSIQSTVNNTVSNLNSTMEKSNTNATNIQHNTNSIVNLQFTVTDLQEQIDSIGSNNETIIVDGGHLPVETVEKLPTALGTEVPSSGTIEKVYINTSLSDEEILEILKSVELVNVPDMGTVYMVTASADMTSGIGFLGDANYGLYYFTVNVNGENTQIWNTDDGWVNKMSTLTVGYDNALALLLSQLGGTVQNDKLKNLISIEPFVDVHKVYKLIEREPSKWQGTPVPNSGSLEYVYLNTALTQEEIIAIVSQLSYTYRTYDIIDGSGSENFKLYLTTGDGNPYTLSTSGMGGERYWRDTTGWNTQYINIEDNNHPYHANMTELDSSVGAQNELLASLVSSTPFKYVDGKIKGFKYLRFVDGNWIEVINSTFVDVENMSEVDVDLSKVYRVVEKTEAYTKGTTVPNSGTIEYLYHNISLSVPEIESIFNTLEFVDAEYNGKSIKIYYVIDGHSSMFNHNYRIYKDGDAMTLMDDVSCWIRWQNQQWHDAYSASNTDYDFVGWNPGFIENNGTDKVSHEIFPTLFNSDIPVGAQNDKINLVLSTTPFETVPPTLTGYKYYRNVNGKNIEVLGDSVNVIEVKELPDASSADLSKVYKVANYSPGGGSVVPNSGTVGKVYFNTSMSDSEVEALLSQLTYDQSRDGINPLLWVNSEASSSSILIAAASAEGMYALLNILTNKIYWANQTYVDNAGSHFGVTRAGWQEFDNPIEVNAEVSSEGEGDIPVGAQNDLIKELFYTEPLVNEELLECQYYRAINGEWVEVLNNGGSSDFIDVEELPSLTSETAVPNSGYVEKVYFNTSLSDDEIKKLIYSITLTEVPNFGTLYPVVIDSAIANAIFILQYEGGRAIILMVNGETTDLWSSDEGWINATTEIPIRCGTYLSSFSSQIGILLQNDTLKSFISATPFGTNSDLDLSKIYRVANYSFGGGTVVPNSGTVGKVYFNTNLSDEEIINLLSQLTYKDYMHIIFASGANMTDDDATYLSIFNLDNEKFSIGYHTPTSIIFIWCNEAFKEYMENLGQTITTAGWQNFTNPIELNMPAQSTIENGSSSSATQTVGVQNDLIKDLVYTEPLVKGDLLGYNYYRVINGEWREVIKSEEDESKVYIIEKDYNSFIATETYIDNIPLTDDEWSQLLTRDNVIIKLIKNTEVTGGSIKETICFTKSNVINTLSKPSFSVTHYNLLEGAFKFETFEIYKNTDGTYGTIHRFRTLSNGTEAGLTEDKVNTLIANYMTANYGNGDTEEF